MVERSELLRVRCHDAWGLDAELAAVLTTFIIAAHDGALVEWPAEPDDFDTHTPSALKADKSVRRRGKLHGALRLHWDLKAHHDFIEI